jgi:hypothetical protein
MKQNKLLAIAAPLLFVLAAGTANAASLYSPDGGEAGGCSASSYSGEGWDGSFANFEIPAVGHGQTVEVYSNTYNAFGQLTGSTSASFACYSGTLYYSGNYDYDYNWYGY